MSKTITINCSRITDWPSLHDAFSAALGFPRFYGRNLDAWLDCMSSLDEDLSDVRVEPGETVTLRLTHAKRLETSAPQILSTFLEMVEIANCRYAERSGNAVLLVAFES